MKVVKGKGKGSNMFSFKQTPTYTELAFALSGKVKQYSSSIPSEYPRVVSLFLLNTPELFPYVLDIL